MIPSIDIKKADVFRFVEHSPATVSVAQDKYFERNKPFTPQTSQNSATLPQ